MPDLPLVMWMVALSLVIGLAGGLGAAELVETFNAGFGRALGEFALILLPSFVLAAALSRQNIASEAAGRTAALASPIAGAGMICPDTAYAALAPAAGRYKLTTAFGAYTGFKLLYPAGPLIVAAGLGGTILDETPPVLFLLAGAALSLPVWLVGVAWVRVMSSTRVHDEPVAAASQNGRLWVLFAPFLLMASLLLAGGLIGKTSVAVIDFLLSPKGALLSAAIFALFQTRSDERRACLDSAVRRTGSLLLVIGAASAFGAVVTSLVALDRLFPVGSGVATLISLFALTVAFKLAQGSSMATFAAVAPVAAPIVLASGVDPVAAVFAICLGSFIAILPNDSFYWLVRGDAFENDTREAPAIWILSG
ncbi:MAG: permease, partial [Pseudomonadota bacterium]